VNGKDEAFREKLLATFRLEAGEHVDALTTGLIALEKAGGTGGKEDVLGALMREAHSLKGASRAVGRTDIEGICQALESALSAWKRLPQPPELYDTLHAAGDALRGLLAGKLKHVEDIVGRLESLARGEAVVKPEPPAASRGGPGVSETVRVSTARLDSAMRQAEELLSTGSETDLQISGLRDLRRTLSSWKRDWAACGSTPERRRSFFEETGGRIESMDAAISRVLRSAERGRLSFAAMTDTLLQDMKKVLMQAFSSLLEMFPKLVRDLSRYQGKDVELEVRGAEREIDRRILEEMKDPLIHIVRNCMDHGIEKPEERQKKGKPSRGKLLIAISQTKGGNVELLIEDDGAGVDAEKVKSAAVGAGMISREEADLLGYEEALALIFQSGVSTSAEVTGVSGRGIGLAIAKEKVEKTGGRISVESSPSTGTRFRITLPVTFAVFRGIVFRACGRVFALPTADVERVVLLDRKDIRNAENRETFSLGGRTVPLIRLDEILDIPGSASEEETGKLTAVVVSHGDTRVAVPVDELVDEREMLMKDLGKCLRRVENVAGAAVLETGKLVPVLLVPDMMRAVRTGKAVQKPRAVPAEAKPAKKKSVLVVEDSITSRMLLKNILEGAGYDVGVAVDGIDAFTALRSGRYDIVVSDVQMPRMNGFDLTAKIRADKKLAETPIVLVTAMESREDRERGIDVGANAYIVKSSFDQGNLIEAVRRLL
jgi:two-component system chemotaxis sensor kinase CheA